MNRKTKLYVNKRGGRMEEVHIDKITSRIKKLCYGLNMEFVDPVSITLKVIGGIYSGVSTVELDNLAAETAASLSVEHPDYAVLAARIAISNLHKETHKQFSDVVRALYEMKDPHTQRPTPMISEQHYTIVMQNKERLDSAIVYDRDFNYNYFGFKTLERSYLLKINNKVAERPQHMLMRVAVGIHGEDLEAALHTYDLTSRLYFTHASPTLFAAATPRPQLSSCFLLAMRDDSIDGIYSTLRDCALISKSAGGIGLHVHKVRARGSYIAGTNGVSNGLVPMLRVFNNTARYVDQGGNKRPGAFAVYLEPWHADVFEFLDLKKNTGKEEERARDLFYALWVPDLFMRRVEADGDWTLMCPAACPGLPDCWGEAFEELYCRYEKEGRGVRKVRAQTLWRAVVEAQVETGTPYLLYKDACNRKSNQSHLGTIQCSNLCTEVVQYTSPEEIAVCNLASVALNMFVRDDRTYDFDHLRRVTERVTRNLDRVITVNHYPVEEARVSNMRHRPLGIGVQGLADAFALMRLPYDSEGAAELNRDIFETMYFGALTASCAMAAEQGAHPSYPGSPASRGQLQHDMWGVPDGPRWNWAKLRADIAQHGLRNSLLLAPMPTASTAQILGNNESFEPFTSNLYCRRVLSGEFPVVNKHLLRDLTAADLWDERTKNQLLLHGGSVQELAGVPEELRALYKTAWEISPKATIRLAVERGAYIDQSQSFNIHVADPNYGKLSSIHFHGWKAGLKTGMYYLRTKAAANAIQFTVDKSVEKKEPEPGPDPAALVCSLQNGDQCLSCGS